MGDSNENIVASSGAIDHDEKKGPSDPDHINPKVAHDIAYWSKELGVTGPILHEAIRMHGTSVEKVKKALAAHEVNLT